MVLANAFISNPGLIYWGLAALIMLVMGVVFFVAGVFLAYFGHAEVKRYGAIQVVVGVAIVVFVFLAAWLGILFPAELTLFPDVIQPALLVLGGIVVGAILPGLLFLRILARR